MPARFSRSCRSDILTHITRRSEGCGFREAVRPLRKLCSIGGDDQPSSDPAETAELLEVLCDPKVRTDQIVALSRLAGLDLFAMVCGRPAVRLAGQLGINDPILDELTLTSFETATRAWAVQVRSEQSYRLSGAVAGKEAVLIPGTWSGSRSPGAMADGRGFQRRFARCTSYTIPDQSASSYFHGGQVIFLEPPSTPPQAGDLIAIYPVARESSVEPVLGRLVRRSDQNVTIELQGGGRRRIALSQIGSMLRVAFCAF